MEEDQRYDNRINKPFINTIAEIIDQKMKLCRGCSNLISDIMLSTPVTGCTVPPIFTEGVSCPCLVCLVKPTCGQTCDKFLEYEKRIDSSYKIIVRQIVDNYLQKLHMEKPKKERISCPIIGTPTCFYEYKGKGKR